MKLRLKLPMVFAIALLAVLTAALLGIHQLNQVLDTYKTQVFDNERAAAEVLNTFKTQVQEWKNVLLRGKNPEQLARYWAAFEKQEASVQSKARKLSGQLSAGEARALVDRFIQAHEQMGSDYRKGLEKFKAEGFDPAIGDAAVKGMDREPTQLLDQAGRSIQKTSESTAARAAERAEKATVASVAVMLLVCCASVLGSVMFIRSVTRRLDHAVSVSRAVAQGDLTAANMTQGKDEIAELLNALHAMQDSLAKVVSHVRQNADIVASASTQIAQGSQDLSARTEQQAGALQQTSASMEELSSTVQANADNARQANQLAANASSVATQGGEVVTQVVSTMKGINESSKRIADIIGVIDAIAFQTNILALNAAVEAARAGEQGRGFAVVASEVRSLAGRSAQAAKEIKVLIGASVERVELGSALVDKAGATMSEVVAAIRRVTDIVGEISAASSEQSTGVAQVGEAVMHMDQATQQNAALVEQSAAAASSLQHQAHDLVQTVSVFKLKADYNGPMLAAPPSLQRLPRPARA